MLHKSPPERKAGEASHAMESLEAALATISSSATQVADLVRMQQIFFEMMLRVTQTILTSAATNTFAMQEAALRAFHLPDATDPLKSAASAKQIEELWGLQRKFIDMMTLRISPGTADSAPKSSVATHGREAAEPTPAARTLPMHGAKAKEIEFAELASKITDAFGEAVRTAVQDHIKERHPVYGFQENK
jgi:hypothetical protein